jgi:hypothetical protein
MEYCKKCGAQMVLNPKTTKMFCKDKCWLKAQEFGASTSQPPQDKLEALHQMLIVIDSKINKLLPKYEEE